MISRSCDPDSPSSSQILEFLQAGLDMGLALSTLKVQVAAISTATSRRWAEDPLIIQFFKAVRKIRPPTKQAFPTWDLAVILEALASPPFAPSDSASLWNLTLKLTFLIAITSGRRVSELQALGADDNHIIFYHDRVELRTVRGFIPKVTSSLAMSEPWALPTFLEQESGSLHELDIASTLKCYLRVTAPFRDSTKLLIIPWGKNKGKEASARTIASWIVKLIHKVYRARGLCPPLMVRAHSTRMVSASWVARAIVSIETICRPATWSSQHTFLKHY